MVSRPLPLFARSRMRLGQDRSLTGALRRLADQRSTVGVARGHKGRGHVAAEQRDVGDMRAVTDGEGARRNGRSCRNSPTSSSHRNRYSTSLTVIDHVHPDKCDAKSGNAGALRSRNAPHLLFEIFD
jgi:hypothetical protein